MNNFQLEPIPHTGEQILTGKYQTPMAVSRTVIVRLNQQNRYLVYSPGEPLLQQAAELLGKDAEIVLVAPSSGHTLGIAPWLAAFPEARIVAATGTAEKLQKNGITGATFLLPEALAEELPEHISMFLVPQCKGGEIWLTVALDGKTWWLVCDGLMNLTALSDSFIKALLQRIYGLRLGLWMTPIFVLNVIDKVAFKQWFNGWLNEQQQPVLIPCHGDVYGEPDLTQTLQALVEKRLKS
ncbi:MAG: hypothetical protein LAT62_15800 [Natronospirillum sp.]|uniref:hypothetical protein n=1 Tax=Natronospirillum sp. TaxID=2812955 RepID=UPI0025FA1A27|nr:hypothetical protein [Natronospirillum sp.]MCH8553402.1 hypothetical protein [Natronospirillum sp.]